MIEVSVKTSGVGTGSPQRFKISPKDSVEHSPSMSDKEMLYIKEFLFCFLFFVLSVSETNELDEPIQSFIAVFNPNGGNQKK